MESGPQRKHHKETKEETKESGCFFCKGTNHKKRTALRTTPGVQKGGCLSCRKPIDGERYIYVGDGKWVEVESIGVFRLLLKTGFYLDLKETFVVLSFRRNLISISALDKFGYSCSFGNSQFSLFQDSKFIGTGLLS
ncbi:unnamed protein product, partial [Cuscuta europaea]